MKSPSALPPPDTPHALTSTTHKYQHAVKTISDERTVSRNEILIAITNLFNLPFTEKIIESPKDDDADKQTIAA
jgi:hypothetical protein